MRETIAPARSRRVSLSWMQALAAAATIALAAGGTVWVAIERGATTAPPPQAATAPSMSAPAGASAIPARFSDAEYDRAVADLTQVLETNRAKMSPRTVQVLERNLATIDRAIAEARAALAQDPSNAFLNEHLVDQRRVKLALLRQARDVVRAGP